VPSRWEVTNGKLRHTSNSNNNINDNPNGEAPESHPDLLKLGTAAVMDGNNDAHLKNGQQTIRISVRLISNYSNGAIGVMFRYQDKNNYYRFSIDNNSRYWWLIKVVKGTPIVLWQIDKEYEAGREYLFIIDYKENHLACYFEGSQLFAVNDNDIDSRRVGLYCWKNPGARFIGWQVSQPIWETHYRFVKENHLAAGKRIRVYSGSPPIGVSGLAR
jgi:hypothetical protein